MAERVGERVVRRGDGNEDTSSPVWPTGEARPAMQRGLGVVCAKVSSEKKDLAAARAKRVLVVVLSQGRKTKRVLFFSCRKRRDDTAG